MMSASCDKGTEGCTDSNACNYDDTAAISDNSCWFVSEGCDCSDLPGSKADCLGVCDPDNENDAPDDDGDGICNEGVIGGCIDTTICNYNQFATHNNDSCHVLPVNIKVIKKTNPMFCKIKQGQKFCPRIFFRLNTFFILLASISGYWSALQQSF